MKRKIYLTSLLLSMFALQFGFDELMQEPQQEKIVKQTQTTPGTTSIFKRNPERQPWDSSPHG